MNPDEGLIRVNVSVTEVTNPDPLQLSLYIETEDGIPISNFYTVAGSMTPYGHQLAVGDHLEFENDPTTWSGTDPPLVELQIGVGSINNIDISGYITFEIWFSLSGHEEEEETSALIPGFELSLCLMALILVQRVFNSRRN